MTSRELPPELLFMSAVLCSRPKACYAQPCSSGFLLATVSSGPGRKQKSRYQDLDEGMTAMCLTS
jgi:hypothetical protein